MAVLGKLRVIWGKKRHCSSVSDGMVAYIKGVCSAGNKKTREMWLVLPVGMPPAAITGKPAAAFSGLEWGGGLSAPLAMAPDTVCTRGGSVPGSASPEQCLVPRVSPEHVLGPYCYSVMLCVAVSPLSFRALRACPLAPCPGGGELPPWPQDTPARPTPVQAPLLPSPCVVPSLFHSSP